MTTLMASVVQCTSRHLDSEANARLTARAIREQADAGAQLVVLPELVSTSYDPEASSLLSIAESVDDPGPCLSAWASVAAETGTAVVAGFAERVGDSLFNSAVVIDVNGSIIEVYRKLHLFGGEQGVFSPGDRGLPLVDLLGVRLGVAVCYDLRFPETLRILAVRGCEMVAVPTAWVLGFDKAADPSGRIGQVDGVVVQANLNQLFVLAADQVGETRGTSFLGRSLIVDPYGQLLAGPLSPAQEEAAMVLVDTELVHAARHRGRGIDPMQNRRIDVYASDLGYRHEVPAFTVRPVAVSERGSVPS